MENYSFLLYVFCFIVFLMIGKVFVNPIKKTISLLINSFFGAILIYIINSIGNNYNFHIGLNFWTMLGTGFLGIPGIVLIVALKLIG